MKTINILLATFAIGSALSFVNCSSSPKKNEAEKQIMSATILNTAQRGVQKTQAKEMGYKTLAKFEKGISNLTLAEIAALTEKAVSLVVFYESDAPWAANFSTGNFTTTGSDVINGLMASYELTITRHFAIDDMNEAIILENSTGIIKDVMQAATEFSMVEHVLMVELKENPTPATNPETVSY